MHLWLTSLCASSAKLCFLCASPEKRDRCGLNFFTTTTPSTLGCPLLKVTRDFFNTIIFSTSTQLMNNNLCLKSRAAHRTFVYLAVEPPRNFARNVGPERLEIHFSIVKIHLLRYKIHFSLVRIYM